MQMFNSLVLVFFRLSGSGSQWWKYNSKRGNKVKYCPTATVHSSAVDVCQLSVSSSSVTVAMLPGARRDCLGLVHSTKNRPWRHHQSIENRLILSNPSHYLKIATSFFTVPKTVLKYYNGIKIQGWLKWITTGWGVSFEGTRFNRCFWVSVVSPVMWHFLTT